MKTKLNSSGEFAHLVSQLQRSPHDPALKQEVVKHLPEMKALAKVNPLALFHLAQIHPENSKQYQEMMRQSAELGCTNAMLALATVLVNSKNPLDLHKAAQFILKIAASHDSYIQKHAQELVEANQNLADKVQELTSHVKLRQSSRFFSKAHQQFHQDGTFNDSLKDFLIQ